MAKKDVDSIKKRRFAAFEALDEFEQSAIRIVRIRIPVPEGCQIVDYVPVAAQGLAKVAVETLIPGATLKPGERLQFDVSSNNLKYIDANGIQSNVCCELPSEEFFYFKVMCSLFVGNLNRYVKNIGTYRFSGDRRFYEWVGDDS